MEWIYLYLIEKKRESLDSFIIAYILIFVLSFVALFISYLLHAIIHELGHLLIAKIFKCEMIALKIPFMVIEKINSKYKIKFNKKLFSNECIITEPKNNKRYVTLGIVLGGIVFQILMIIAVWFVHSSNSNVPLVICLKASNALGILIVLVNSNCIQMKEINDGLVARSIIFEKNASWEYVLYHRLVSRLRHVKYEELDLKSIEYNRLDEIGYQYSKLSICSMIIAVKHYISKSDYYNAQRIINLVMTRQKLIKSKRYEIELEHLYLIIISGQYINEDISTIEKRLHSLEFHVNELDYLRCKIAYEIIILKNLYLVENSYTLYQRYSSQVVIKNDYIFLIDELKKINGMYYRNNNR